MSAEWDDVVDWLDLFLGNRFRTEDLLKGLTEQGWYVTPIGELIVGAEQ